MHCLTSTAAPSQQCYPLLSCPPPPHILLSPCSALGHWSRTPAAAPELIRPYAPCLPPDLASFPPSPPGSAFEVVKGANERINVKRLPKKPAPARFGRKLTARQQELASHICVDCGWVYAEVGGGVGGGGMQRWAGRAHRPCRQLQAYLECWLVDGHCCIAVTQSVV